MKTELVLSVTSEGQQGREPLARLDELARRLDPAPYAELRRLTATPISGGPP